MFPQLCPPVPPFQSTYLKVWFMQLNAVLALNGVTDQPLMHAILQDALPVEFRHLSGTSTSSQQPYDDLCSAVLASCGLTYHPLPFTRDFQVFPASQRAGPSGPKLSSGRNLTSPTTSHSTLGPATSATSHLESWFEEFAAALYHNGIWIQELMYEVLEYHLPHDLKHHLTYFSWSPRPYDHLRDAVLKTPLAPQPVQTIPLPATGHIDSTPAAAPCTVAFAAETWSAELSVPDNSTTSAGPADLPADSPHVPAPVEAHDTTHTMDPEPAVTLHAISFPCTPVPAAQNLVDCQHLLTSSSMCPTEVQAPEHARLNVYDAVTMSGNPEGRTPGSPQVEHTVHAPTDAQLNHPPTTTYACLSISTPSTAHDNCDTTYPPLDLASPNVGSSSNNATTHRRTPARYTSSKRTVSNLSASYSADQAAAAAGNVPPEATVPAR
ncbi:hypothetical protein HPB51_016117 [Rhipicephalus microplus]|uniref:Uncharacterized protein n=1 Tax=Rhipicephalus microplus TaxID=6941 RepID=A0A9J6DV86_RHIMP|nr:hypothetical protein HPB51_016117 [Rhipicephalus microplus]